MQLDGLAAEDLGRRLVDQEVAALDRVETCGSPMVLLEVARAAPMPPWAAPVWERVG